MLIYNIDLYHMYNTMKTAQPKWHHRKKPGTTWKGHFYHIEIRPKSQFTSFRVQDVWEKGWLERVAWRRSSGSWDTVAWLISKDVAHVTKDHKLIIDDEHARSVLSQIRWEISWVKWDIFTALPRKNVPEKDKPTPAQRTAWARNIKLAQKEWQAMHAE